MTFLEIKNQHKTFESFFEWLLKQEFEDYLPLGRDSDYANLHIGNRLIQERMYGHRRAFNIFAPASTEEYYTWEEIIGEYKVKTLADKYDARFMETPYTDKEDSFVLRFKTFEGIAQYLWDTAEEYQQEIENFKQQIIKV